MSLKRFSQLRNIITLLIAVLALLISSVVWAPSAEATPGLAVTAQLLASGNLPEPVRVKIKGDLKSDMDVNQVLTYQITIAPSGTTGWHQHGGPRVIVVASRTLTYCRADDPTCTGIQYPSGSAILDAGFDRHLVRNEGTVDVVT